MRNSGELFDCSQEVLKDLEAVKRGLVEAARRGQATIVAMTFHQFNGQSIVLTLEIIRSRGANHGPFLDCYSERVFAGT